MERPAQDPESLFVRALELPPGAERDGLLARECAQNPTLREEIQSLLRAHEAAGDFLPEDSTPRIPGYTLEHRVGQGSLGIVYAARDEKLNRRVALKVLRPWAGEPVRQRVLNEARKAAALNDPAIVTVYSVLDETEPPAIVMEWVEGYAIDRYTAQLNSRQKAQLLREVARGLSAAHGRGLVHRDLKPDNILVGPDMRPRILDFGLALTPEEAGETDPAEDAGSIKGRGPGSRHATAFAGTPLYASPEQLAGRPLTPASDVFSFGAVMFKVLTGRVPFPMREPFIVAGGSWQTGGRRNVGTPTAGSKPQEAVKKAGTTETPPFLREVALDVPEELQAICMACLAPEPKDRPSADELVLEIGRFLLGEPVRLRPRLYDDLLRSSITDYSLKAATWENQNIISREENDALQGLHRRLLAEEDHWIIDARRVTLLQTILSGGTWLAVVATLLTVWLLRNELSPTGRWLIPLGFTLTLLVAGNTALRRRDPMAAATFLAGTVLASAPCCLALLGQTNLFGTPAPGIAQLFPGIFSNQQVLVASLAALVLSGFGLWRLKMTGFAWTTAALGTAAYVGVLLLFNWLDRKPEVQALWCLPLVASELIALRFEKLGRVRWTLPFHVVAALALIGGLDTIALKGPTLELLGVRTERWTFFDQDRLQAISVALNGVCFLILTLITERSGSLDLRRASKLLEVLAILHILSALFLNALDHRGAPYVRADVWLYVTAALTLVALAAVRSRWRMLVGGLAGCGLGSYLLVDLGLVARQPFIIGLGLAGLFLALGAFLYVQRRQAR